MEKEWNSNIQDVEIWQYGRISVLSNFSAAFICPLIVVLLFQETNNMQIDAKHTLINLQYLGVLFHFLRDAWKKLSTLKICH